MVSKRKPPPPSKYDNLVYIVQDYEQQLCGVFSTLAKAAECYERVLSEGLSEEDKQQLIEEYGEDYHDELEYPACIIVYKLDSSWIESYDTMREIREALEKGEEYE